MKILTKSRMSPLQVEILLFYWYTGGEDFPRIRHATVRETIDGFARYGLLVKMSEGNNPEFTANREALDPYINAVLALPLPVKRWVMPSEAVACKARAIKVTS